MKKLCFLGIVLISFTSLPVMPSTYRPVSILLMLVPGTLYALSMLRRREIYDLLLFLFVIYIGGYSFILYGVFDFSYTYLIESSIILTLGILSYYGFNYAFENLSYERLFKAFQVLVNLFLVVATLDIVLFLSGDILGLRSIIFEFIGGKVGSRPQYTTSEAAWAAQVILFLIPIQTWIYAKTNGYYDKLKIGYLYLLMLLTFSLLGYVLVLVYVSVLYIYLNKNKLKAVAKIMAIGSITIAIIFSTLIYFAGEDSYTLNRIERAYNEAELTDIYNVDASAYIRTLYPKVGYDIFEDYPLGIGMGAYPLMFGDYIIVYDYEMLYNEETQRNIREKNNDPKNFYAKILSEFGIISGLLFALLIYLIGRKKDALIFYDNDVRTLVFSVNVSVFLIFMQFSSLATIPFWFCVSLNKNYKALIKSYKVYLTNE